MGWWDNLRGAFSGSSVGVGATNRLREQMPFLYDPDFAHTAEQIGPAYSRRLTSSPRDLNPILQDRMIEVAVYLYDSNPLAKRMIRLMASFVVGEGIHVRAAGDEGDKKRDAIQEVIDRFWDDWVNNMDVALPQKVRNLGIFGEQVWPVFVNPVDGHVRLGWIDPVRIKALIKDPGNDQIVKAVELKTPAAAKDRIFYKVITEDENPNSDTYGKLITHDPEDVLLIDEDAFRYEGDCFYDAVNTVHAGGRGRSDLLAEADWVDQVDKALFNESDRSALTKNYVWDVTVEGDQPAVNKYAEENPAPEPGSVRYHNKGVEWNAVAPNLQMHDAATLNDLLTSYVATGIGFSKTWLNGTIDVNRATASEMGEPAYKELTERQKLWVFMLKRLILFVLDQADIAGVQGLERPKKAEGTIRPSPWPVEVQAPEIRARDVAALGGTLSAVVTAVVAAMDGDVIDLDVAQDVTVMMLGLLGVEVNLAEMRKRIEKEKAKREEEAKNAPYNQPGAGAPGEEDEDGAPPTNGNGAAGDLANAMTRELARTRERR